MNVGLYLYVGVCIVNVYSLSCVYIACLLICAVGVAVNEQADLSTIFTLKMYFDF